MMNETLLTSLHCRGVGLGGSTELEKDISRPAFVPARPPAAAAGDAGGFRREPEGGPESDGPSDQLNGDGDGEPK
jgi:hypothetical protein